MNFKDFMLIREYKVFDDQMINEMANLSKKRTGLDFIIYVSNKDGVNHGPRIKVNSDKSDKWSGESFTVTIDSEPRVIGKTSKAKQSDVEDVIDWVQLNREHLLKCWNNSPEYDIGDLFGDLRKL